jgi:hypothetical protein
MLSIIKIEVHLKVKTLNSESIAKSDRTMCIFNFIYDKNIIGMP